MLEFDIPKRDEAKELREVLFMMEKHLERNALHGYGRGGNETTAIHTVLPHTLRSEPLNVSSMYNRLSRNSARWLLKESLWYVIWLVLTLAGIGVYFWMLAHGVFYR